MKSSRNKHLLFRENNFSVKGVIKMNEVAKMNNEVQTTNSKTELELITQDLLLDTVANLEQNKTIKVPISELATLGAGVSSLIPKMAQITQTTSFPVDGLYRLVNKGVDDVLKQAKDGTFWGALKKADGSSKMLKLQSVDSLAATTTSNMVMPIDPATAMMAVALYSIEKELGKIAEMEREILSFLELEKKAEIEADVETLMDITRKYKTSWDNEHFIASNHKLVLDIQRTARKNTNFYFKKIEERIKNKKLTLSQTQVNSLLKDLENEFKYYRLSLYTYSLASLMEIMLSGNFKEEYISGIKTQIISMSTTYRNLFEESSIKLEKISSTAIEANMLKGIGTVGNAFGKAIGRIPLVEKGSLDEFLENSGEKLKVNAQSMENKPIKEFAALNNPRTFVFIEKMDDMITIFNHSNSIAFDKDYLYLSA